MLIAAIVSSVTGFNADICDAWAAIIVTVTIIAIVIPLIREIYYSYKKLCEISSS